MAALRRRGAADGQKPVEERGRHLGVSEDARPFAEGQIGRDDDRGALIELAHEMEEQLPASLSEGQIAKFVENGEVLAGEIIGDPSLTPCACFGFQAINEIDCIEETATQTGADAALRCCATKPPPARSRTRVSLTVVPSKSKSSMSLARGSLAMVI